MKGMLDRLSWKVCFFILGVLVIARIILGS